MTDQLLYSLEDAAARLGIGRSSLYQLMGDGRIATVHIGRRRFIAPEELDRFVASLVPKRRKVTFLRKRAS